MDSKADQVSDFDFVAYVALVTLGRSFYLAVLPFV